MSYSYSTYNGATWSALRQPESNVSTSVTDSAFGVISPSEVIPTDQIVSPQTIVLGYILREVGAFRN